MNGNIDPTYRQLILSNLDHHKPNDEQLERITMIRRAAKSFVSVLMDQCVVGADLERALSTAREAMMFGVASIVLETPPAKERTQPRAFMAGERVYHRKADLFGSIRTLDSEYALVKYEWPNDPDAVPTSVLLSVLVHADEVLER